MNRNSEISIFFLEVCANMKSANFGKFFKVRTFKNLKWKHCFISNFQKWIKKFEIYAFTDSFAANISSTVIVFSFFFCANFSIFRFTFPRTKPGILDNSSKSFF